MLNISILCVGKLKERFYTEAAAEYVKRLGGYCRLNLAELPEERLPERPSRAQIDAALVREGEALLQQHPQGRSGGGPVCGGSASLQRRSGPAHGPTGCWRAVPAWSFSSVAPMVWPRA